MVHHARLLHVLMVRARLHQIAVSQRTPSLVTRYFLAPLTLNPSINFTVHQDDMPENIPSVFMPEK